MANLGMNFDPSTVAPDSGRGAFPAGRYLMQVIESDVVDTKAGDGKILKLVMEVYDGPYERRRVWEQLNIQNPSQKAQAIALSQLSALTRAAGITHEVTESEDLHFKPFEAMVGIEPGDSKPGGGTYPEKNRINRYIFDGADAPPATKAAPAPTAKTAPAPAARTGNRPWDRGRTAA